MKKIIFLLGEEKERTAGNNGMEGGESCELHIGFIGEAEEMEGLIVGTILIEKPVIGDKTGIIDFLFQNGNNVRTVRSGEIVVVVFACEIKAVIMERQVRELRNIVSKDFHSEGFEVKPGKGGEAILSGVPDINEATRDRRQESGIHMPIQDRIWAERGESTG